MVLLDNIVEVAAAAHQNGPPSGVFLAQQPDRPVARRIATKIHFARPDLAAELTLNLDQLFDGPSKP